MQVQVFQETASGLDVASTDLILDTFVDATTFRPVQRYAEDSDEIYGNYCILVKGVLLDQSGACPVFSSRPVTEGLAPLA
jgi:hypothetical protein